LAQGLNYVVHSGCGAEDVRAKILFCFRSGASCW